MASALLQRHLTKGAPWHPIDEASDQTLASDDLSLTALRCTTCGRVLSAANWNKAELRWVCPGYAGDGLTMETAAARRLGPFAPPRGLERLEPIPGFVQTGTTTFERIREPDRQPPWPTHARAPQRIPWLRLAMLVAVLWLLLR
jgi:hypothetical protein